MKVELAELVDGASALIIFLFVLVIIFLNLFYNSFIELYLIPYNSPI